MRYQQPDQSEVGWQAWLQGDVPCCAPAADSQARTEKVQVAARLGGERAGAVAGASPSTGGELGLQGVLAGQCFSPSIAARHG